MDWLRVSDDIVVGINLVLNDLIRGEVELLVVFLIALNGSSFDLRDFELFLFVDGFFTFVISLFEEDLLPNVRWFQAILFKYGFHVFAD